MFAGRLFLIHVLSCLFDSFVLPGIIFTSLGKKGRAVLLSLAYSMCAVYHTLFTLRLSVISRQCSVIVALPGYLYYCSKSDHDVIVKIPFASLLRLSYDEFSMI